LRDEFAGPGDAQPHSQPARVPRDLDLHRLAPQGTLEPRDLASRLVGLGPFGIARQPLGAGREELLAPLAQQAVGDVVSRQSSVVVFEPRGDASSSSVFCCAVNVRYLRCSLIDPLDR
jgi:hypothetical protein